MEEEFYYTAKSFNQSLTSPLPPFHPEGLQVRKLWPDLELWKGTRDAQTKQQKRL